MGISCVCCRRVQTSLNCNLQVPRHAKGLICFRVEERSRPSRIIRGAGIGLCDVMNHLRWVLHWMLDLVLQGQIYTCCHFLSMMLEW